MNGVWISKLGERERERTPHLHLHHLLHPYTSTFEVIKTDAVWQRAKGSPRRGRIYTPALFVSPVQRRIPGKRCPATSLCVGKVNQAATRK